MASESDSPQSQPPHPDAPPRTFDAATYLEGIDASGGALDTVSTGYPSLDALLGGGPRLGDLIVIGGDVGCGKSALAMGIALRTAESSRSAAYFSGEFSTDRMFERALCMQARTTIDDMRHGRLDDESRAALGAVALKLRQRAPMFAPMPPGGLAGMSDLLIEYLGIDLIVVDPLQSLASGRLDAEEELATAMRDLKALAVRRDCIVLAVSHLQTVVRDRPDPRPTLGDFGARGAIRHHADIILSVYREELYQPAKDIDGATEVHVLKNRNGALGYADLFFYKQWARMEDLSE